MNRFPSVSHGRFAGPWLCGLLLLMAASTSVRSWEPPMAVAASPASSLTGDVGSLAAQPFVAIAKQAKASVVNISSVKKKDRHQSESPFFDDPLFRRFFGEEFARRLPAPRAPEEGLGSGVIVTTDGYIVTNNHVVEGADELTVSCRTNGRSRQRSSERIPRPTWP